MGMPGEDGLPNYARNVAQAVLDAIEAAGPGGADMETLVGQTSYDNCVLNEVLGDLLTAGLTSTTDDRRHRVTPLGHSVRSLASH